MYIVWVSSFISQNSAFIFHAKWHNFNVFLTFSDKEAAPSSASDTGGAADSSDEVQQMSGEAAAADDGGHQEAAGDVTGDVGEAAPVEEGEDNQCQPSTSSSSSSPNLSSESSHQPQSDNNSPDQSDTSVQWHVATRDTCQTSGDWVIILSVVIHHCTSYILNFVLILN